MFFKFHERDPKVWDGYSLNLLYYNVGIFNLQKIIYHLLHAFEEIYSRFSCNEKEKCFSHLFLRQKLRSSQTISIKKNWCVCNRWIFQSRQAIGLQRQINTYPKESFLLPRGECFQPSSVWVLINLYMLCTTQTGNLVI